MRISVFVDAANLFFIQKFQLKWFVDLEKLLLWIGKKGEVVSATYYIGTDEEGEPKQHHFLDHLPELGYSLVTKPVKTIFDSETQTNKKKANLDIEIVLDMFNTLEHYDMAVLISGDGDFLRALDLLKARGKQILIISTEGAVAKELRQMAGQSYFDFQDIKNELLFSKE